MTETLWELINPSDAYTMAGDDYDVAAVACLLLGEGHMGLVEIGGARRVPIMLFGLNDAWAQEGFGCTVTDLCNRVMKEKRTALADALASVMIASPAERASYTLALEFIDDPTKRQTYRDRWHDRQRSSLNDIGKRAWEMADRIRGRGAS